MSHRRRTIAGVATGGLLLVLFGTWVHCSSQQDNPATDAGPADTYKHRDVEGADLYAPPIDGAPSPCDLSTRPASDWPGWNRVQTVSPCCPMDTPADLVASSPKWNWKPCVTGRPNCQEMVQDWRTDGIQSYFTYVQMSADNNGTPQLFSLGTRVTEKLYQLTIFDFASKAPIAAWRKDGSLCSLDSYLFGQQAGVYSFQDALPFLVGYGKPADLMANLTLVPLPDGIHKGQAGIEVFGISDTTMVFDIQAGGRVVRTTLPPGSAPYVISTLPPGTDFSQPFVVGNDVYANSEYGTGDGWSQEYRIDPDGTSVLYRGTKGRHMCGFASDGKTMFWMELSGDANPLASTYPLIEIWAAPYARDPTVLASTAKALGTVPNNLPKGFFGKGGSGVARGGYYILPQAYGVVLARISDGLVKVVVPDNTNRSFYWAPYVSDTELWVTESEFQPAEHSGISFERIGITWP